jgi:hypothetical protein
MQVLKVNVDHLADLAGVLNLTSCTRLKNLCVDARSTEGLMDRVLLEVTGEEVRAWGLQCGSAHDKSAGCTCLPSRVEHL